MIKKLHGRGGGVAYAARLQEFADTDLGERLHESMIKAHCVDRLVGHLSRDSSAIPVCEMAAKKDQA